MGAEPRRLPPSSSPGPHAGACLVTSWSDLAQEPTWLADRLPHLWGGAHGERAPLMGPPDRRRPHRPAFPRGSAALGRARHEGAGRTSRSGQRRQAPRFPAGRRDGERAHSRECTRTAARLARQRCLGAPADPHAAASRAIFVKTTPHHRGPRVHLAHQGHRAQST